MLICQKPCASLSLFIKFLEALTDKGQSANKVFSIGISGMTMKIRAFFSGMIAVLAFSGVCFAAISANAQQNLPWQQGQGSASVSEASGQRVYQEPGEAYDPLRHGSPRSNGENIAGGRQQLPGNGGYGQGYGSGYDRGYDALRNNGGGAQGYGNGQPGSNSPRQGYGQENREPYSGYDRQSGQYRQQDRYRQPYQQPDNAYPRRMEPPAYPRQGGDYRGGYQPPASQGPGQAYAPPPVENRPPSAYERAPQRRSPQYEDTYSDDEILAAGHRFFGKVTKGLAKVVAHVFKKSGRPNAYILGEEGGGALIAGLRYGEGTIYTKSGGRQPVYWQGPSIGYDFGAEGAKTMILVYNLRDINDIYNRFAGVDGSAYLVGGVGVTFQKRGRVVLAPIRSGLGLRLGANVGYLKYTRRPTWNPF